MINIKRIKIILQNSISNLITPIISVLFSYIVIRNYSTELWGGFVFYLIIVNLSAHILSWGNKEYLLREFSRNASDRAEEWVKSFTSRIIFIPIVFIPYYFISGTFRVSLMMFVLTLFLFIYQSFDVFITYERKFLLTVYAELISFILLVTMIFLKGVSGVENILVLYIYSFIFKPVFLLVYFRGDFHKGKNFNIRADFKFFKYAFPFFILGLAGMIQSRFDIYCVSYFLNKELLGKYQVIANFLGVFQSASIFIVAPFVKDIYRLKEESIMKMSKNVFLSGIALLIPFIIIFYIMIFFIYKFDLSIDYYLYSAFYILPVYYYIVPVYMHYKFGKQNRVIFITVIGIITGLISNIFLIPILGIKGALISSGFSQILMCGIYYLSVRKINIKVSGVTI